MGLFEKLLEFGLQMWEVYERLSKKAKEEREFLRKQAEDILGFHEGIREKMFRLGDLSAKDFRKQLHQEIDGAKQQMEKLSATQKTVVKRTPIIRRDEVVGYKDELVKVTLTQEEIILNEKRRVELQDQILNNRLRLKELDEAEARAKQKQTEELEKQLQIGIAIARASNPNKLPTTTSQSLLGGVGLGAPKFSQVPVGEQRTQQAPKQQFQELSKESEAFISAFDSGMQAVGAAIQQWVGGAFRRTFGEANSLSLSA